MSIEEEKWELEKKEKNPQLLLNGKLINNKKIEKFHFIEKDFQSTISKQEPAQFLHRRFRILLNVLKNNLGDSFNPDKSDTGRPKKQFGDWTPNQWLWFSRKNWYIEDPKDSLTFQVTLGDDKDKELEVDIWLTHGAKESKLYISKKIVEQKKRFMEILKNLPSHYLIGIDEKNVGKTETAISEIDEAFIDQISETLPKNQMRFFIRQVFSKDQVLQYGDDITQEIVKTFDELIPVSEFLNKTASNAAVKAHSCFILVQNPNSRYDDVEGKQYQYDSDKNNSRKLIEDSKFIIQSEINNSNYFVGYGKIGNISETPSTSPKGKPITKFIAKFSEYVPFKQPLLRTPEILKEMKKTPVGSQPPSIWPISRQLYSKITGENLTENGQDDNIMNLDLYIQALDWKPNLILYGPPGTGKTFHANQIAEKVAGSTPKMKERTWRSLAALVLLENDGKPMNYHEIAKLALEKKLINTQGETPHETLAKEMRNDMDERKEDSLFVKPEDGVYGLNVPTTFEKAAEIILFAENDFMHSDKITEIALKRKMINQKEEPGITPNRSMNQILSQNYKNNKANSKFEKIGPGTYGLRNQISNEQKHLIFKVTFHPSYSYEDFVEGYRPIINDVKTTSYELKKGIFLNACETAEKFPDSKVVLIIDEINRGNIPKILGELITLIEKDKREKKYALQLAYSQQEFFVPENLCIIATMNTADKSLMQMDDALKRRFVFEELMPDTSSLLEHLKKEKVSNAEDYTKILDRINDKILGKGTDDASLRMKQFRDRQIGHSYFWNVKNEENLQSVIRFDIIPLLQDYFYGDYKEIQKILGADIISELNRPTDMVTNPKKANDLKNILLKI